MVDQVGRFGNVFLNIFGMALAIFDTRYMVFSTAGEVIVE